MHVQAGVFTSAQGRPLITITGVAVSISQSSDKAEPDTWGLMWSVTITSGPRAAILRSQKREGVIGIGSGENIKSGPQSAER